jgi:hypothetical protein
MASRGRNKKTEESVNKSGFAALASTEDPDGDENEGPPPDASQSLLLPAAVAELPWANLSYEGYQRDMSCLVRFVSPAGFWELGNPIFGWSADALAKAYKDQNVTLLRGHPTTVSKIIAALIRWRVVSGTLYEHRLLKDSYDSLLDDLLDSLQFCELQWVSARADEPAAFWRVEMSVPVPTAPVSAQMPASTSTKRPAITQTYTEQSSSDTSPSSQGDSSDSAYVNEKIATEVHDQLIAASALPDVMSGAVDLQAVFRQSERLAATGHGGSGTQHRMLKDMKEKASKKARAEVLKQAQKPKPVPVKTRVQDGDPDHGLVREDDLQRVRDKAERNLVRYLTVMLTPYAGQEHEVPEHILQMMSDLYLQAAEDANYGATLTPKPLTASSVLRLGMMNITDATPNVIVIPRLESEIELGKFKKRKAFYRMSNKQMEGRHMDGYLSNSLIAEYSKTFARECLEAHEFCEALIHDPLFL